METNQQDWELVNDDGFIYRRLKRTRLNPTTTTTVSPSDPATEAIARRDRKKKTLLTLKTKYQQEIHHWQLLSNTLHALQQQHHHHSALNQPSPLTSLPPSDHPASVVHDSTYHQLAGNLLTQVEAQEATINEISRLCDVAEEQRLRQSFIDLPIWEQSPRRLIASLLEE